MERLVKDASKMTDIQKELGITVDGTSLSFDNVVNAISVMQNKLGIAGTSAEEATQTIQGSTNRMKAAWENLVTGFGDKEADVGELTKKFIETVVGGTDEAGKHINGVVDNVMPVIQRIIEALPEGIKQISQALNEELPGLASQILPGLVKAALALIKAFAESLPTLLPAILETIKEALEIIKDDLPELLDILIKFIEEALPDLIDAVVEIALQLIDVLTQPDVLTKLVEAAIKGMLAIREGIWRALPKIIEALPKIIENLIKSLLGSIPLLIEAGIKLFTSLVSNLPAIISGIIQAVPQIMTAIWDALNPFGPEMSKIFSAAWEGIKQIFSFDNVGVFFKGVWEGMMGAFSHVSEWFQKTFSEAWDNIKKVFSATGEMFGDIGKSILNGLSSVINGIIWGINQVIKTPFDSLNWILRAIRDINIAGLKPFDWISEIPVPQIPSIPMLAEGGVLKRGQIALLEGQGDEAVIPLSQNTEWIDMVAKRLNESGNGNNNFNINIEIANMNANSREDIEQLADTLMQVMSDKMVRMGAAWR